MYLDNILIFSNNEEEHLKYLDMVLTILRQHDLKAKRSKCEFFKPELKFLGHLISANGMRHDPAKVSSVVDWPTPVSAYEVRSFLGLANYFREYIRAFAATAAPLTALLKGIPNSDKTGKLLRWGRLPPAKVEAIKAAFARTWSPECDSAFTTLKQALTSAPVLTLPDMDKPIELVSDACECPPAVGAVLMQDNRPACFYSRKLSGAELQYSASDIEMQSDIAALQEWRCNLQGSDFTIVTDHAPNTYLDKAENPHTVKRRARWLSVCCGYTYTWVYRPGRVDIADPISRAPQHFPLLCVRTTLVHSMKTCCHGHRLGALNVVASGRVPTGSPFVAPCCHVCSSAAVCATTLPTRTLRSSVAGRRFLLKELPSCMSVQSYGIMACLRASCLIVMFGLCLTSGSLSVNVSIRSCSCLPRITHNRTVKPKTLTV